MNIKQAIQWAEDLAKRLSEQHCVLSCEQLGIYLVLKKAEVKDETKVVYSSD